MDKQKMKTIYPLAYKNSNRCFVILVFFLDRSPQIIWLWVKKTRVITTIMIRFAKTFHFKVAIFTPGCILEENQIKERHFLCPINSFCFKLSGSFHQNALPPLRWEQKNDRNFAKPYFCLFLCVLKCTFYQQIRSYRDSLWFQVSSLGTMECRIKALVLKQLADKIWNIYTMNSSKWGFCGFCCKNLSH